MCFNVSLYLKQGLEWTTPRTEGLRLLLRHFFLVLGPCGQAPMWTLLYRSHRKTFNVTCRPRPRKAPFSAGALGDPKGEALGVERIPSLGWGGREDSPTYSPSRAPQRCPPKGFQEQSPGCGATLPAHPASPTDPAPRSPQLQGPQRA